MSLKEEKRKGNLHVGCMISFSGSLQFAHRSFSFCRYSIILPQVGTSISNNMLQFIVNTIERRTENRDISIVKNKLLKS